MKFNKSEMLNCPCCGNHCDVENLGCGRGRKFFEEQDFQDEKNDNESN